MGRNTIMVNSLWRQGELLQKIQLPSLKIYIHSDTQGISTVQPCL